MKKTWLSKSLANNPCETVLDTLPNCYILRVTFCKSRYSTCASLVYCSIFRMMSWSWGMLCYVEVLATSHHRTAQLSSSDAWAVIHLPMIFREDWLHSCFIWRNISSSPLIFITINYYSSCRDFIPNIAFSCIRFVLQ